MTLFSYCILVDDGAAPNPYWGVCTLTICKPKIRKTAKVGDWVVGVGSKNVFRDDYSGKLVYAMQVTQVLSIREYDAYCRNELQGKIPDIYNEDYRKNVGDCLYDYSGNKRGRQRLGVHDQSGKRRDLSGENALLSDHFFYFGDHAVDIPQQFSVLVRQGQGHQCHKNEGIKFAFVEWLTSSFRPNVLFGQPQVRVVFSKDGTSKTCSSGLSFGEPNLKKKESKKAGSC